MKKEEFDFYVEAGISRREDARLIIQSLINWLIDVLYVPDPDLIRVVNKRLIKKLGLDKDAINWGDLKCYTVEEKAGGYVAYVDEADPSARHLQRYLEGWLAKWGWNVTVITEW
ncbi:MAG: hypothetical protein DRG40_00335 [Deltaproteobacteria bacterium]|nr:MAG: hypothetical protein DRG40_00335 [Deltaproteobacteria bacterium]